MKSIYRLRLFLCIILGILVFCFSGCHKDAKMPGPLKDTLPEDTKQPLKEEVQKDDAKDKASEAVNSHKGQLKSPLTGLWVDKKTAKKRPVAVMINNISYASPQSGIGEASILYEAVVEGGITRLMAIYEDMDQKRIGSVRSARHYFVSFADEYDAIFAHYGHTKYAVSKIKELKVDNLSGLESIGNVVYYRDNSIKAPHNAFASAKGIKKGIKEKGYRTSLKEDLNNHFTFYDKNTRLKGQSAKKVTLGFSGYTAPYFTYNKKKKLYYRYQFGSKHIDAAAKKQLSFKNLIIQYVSYWTIDAKNGYQSMDIENSKGEGLYITNGAAVPITWDKNESKKEMHYYDEKGNLLTINPGKTYIALYPDNRKDNLKLE